MELMDEFCLSENVGIRRKDFLGTDSLFDIGFEFELSQEDVKDYYSHENYKKVLIVAKNASEYESLDELIGELNPNTDVDWEVSQSDAVFKISKALNSSFTQKPYDIVICSSAKLLKACKQLDPNIDAIMLSPQTVERLESTDDSADAQEYRTHLSDYDLFARRLTKSLSTGVKNRILSHS